MFKKLFAGGEKKASPAPAAVAELPAQAIPCPVCGAPSTCFGQSELTDQVMAAHGAFFATWFRVARDRYHYTRQQTWCCTVCGHVFLDPILNDRQTLDLIFEACELSPPSISTDWEDVHFGGTATLWSRTVRVPSLNATLRKYVSRSVRVLDIGAHGGEISLGLDLPAGSTVDLLQSENSITANPPRPGVRQFRGLLQDLPAGSYRADVLLALHVLEHSENPADFLVRSAAIMTPDSILVIEIPYELGLAGQVARGEMFEIPHNCFFSPWSFEALVNRSPLQTVELEMLDNFHTGNGDSAYPVMRAVLKKRVVQPPPEPPAPHRMARTIDRLCGNLSGSLAYQNADPFVVFLYGAKWHSYLRLFEKAPGYRGGVTSNASLPLPNVFQADLSGVKYVLTLNREDRDSLRQSLGSRGVEIY